MISGSFEFVLPTAQAFPPEVAATPVSAPLIRPTARNAEDPKPLAPAGSAPPAATTSSAEGIARRRRIIRVVSACRPPPLPRVSNNRDQTAMAKPHSSAASIRIQITTPYLAANRAEGHLRRDRPQAADPRLAPAPSGPHKTPLTPPGRLGTCHHPAAARQTSADRRRGNQPQERHHRRPHGRCHPCLPEPTARDYRARIEHLQGLA
jgi:hypothetical protein